MASGRESEEKTVITDDICVKAGSNVYQMIQNGAFSFDKITTYVGPAAGPRFLVGSGFDLTLLGEQVLGKLKPVLLAGSSAGALRFAAWAHPDPVSCYRTLLEAYLSMHFSQYDTPHSILLTIENLIDTCVEHEAVPFVLSNNRYRLAITAARVRKCFACENAEVQKMLLGFIFVGNLLSRSLLPAFFQRVVFYNSPIPPQFCLHESFRGMCVPLNMANFKHALMASSSIPVMVEGVRDIYGAPRGVYRDGGLVDYHLNQTYAANDSNVTLLFHHQDRLVPGWLDKRLAYRMPSSENLQNVLLVYPSETFIRKLPGAKVPDRSDFNTYLHDSATRIQKWREAITLSEPLGEQFLELVESGRLRTIVQEMI